MRRIGAALVLLMTLVACAQAELNTFDYDSTYNVCTNFAQELPKDAAQALDGMLREGDEVLCGACKKKCYVRKGREDWDASVLAAVRREGKILLVHASGVNGAWEVTVESDSFLRDGEAFSIETASKDEGTRLEHELTVGDTVYRIGRHNYEGNRLWLTRARRMLEDGSRWTLNIYEDGAAWQTVKDGKVTAEARYKGVIPRRLAAWTTDTFPKTDEEVRAFIDAHDPELQEDEVYLAGVNLRERATGKSRSWGMYMARAQVLEKKQGKQAPWFHVRVGNLDGWASGDYVTNRETDEDRMYTAAAHVQDAARAKVEVPLCDRPGGTQVDVLLEGTLVHVLAQSDGWLHVIVPRGELTWDTDWGGTYGFVKAKNMAVGLSRADAVWKE